MAEHRSYSTAWSLGGIFIYQSRELFRLEETLTLHGLGLFPMLGVSLKTTNCLESLNAQLGQLTDKVDHWRTSDQKQRWVASALSLIEPRLRRIKGYRHLPQLRAALQAKIGKAERVGGTRIA